MRFSDLSSAALRLSSSWALKHCHINHSFTLNNGDRCVNFKWPFIIFTGKLSRRLKTSHMGGAALGR